jgi:hypothetical protein
MPNKPTTYLGKVGSNFLLASRLPDSLPFDEFYCGARGFAEGAKVLCFMG